ncbi:signal peptidase II [Patescibacteria group bacterium]|nr:signal peptidase II [Patescibacteria group bacterium]
MFNSQLVQQKIAMIFMIAVFFIIFDRFFKSLFLGNYFAGPVHIVGDSISLFFQSNYNIAFSLPVTGLFLNVFIIIILLSLLAHTIYLYKKKKINISVFLFIIIMGATSNLFDRLKYGFVVDYFNVSYFSVFNLADAVILFGVVMSLIFYDREKK